MNVSVEVSGGFVTVMPEAHYRKWLSRDRIPRPQLREKVRLTAFAEAPAVKKRDMTT